MIRALGTATTGMQSQQMNIDVIANNIANINTTSFKRNRVEFQDLLYQTEQRMGVSSSNANTVIPTGIQVGLGVNTGSVYRIHEQGELLNTGNNFDMAIGGKGFFMVTLPSGDFAYTRSGTFQINDQGVLVNAKGYEISPSITVPEEAIDVTINENGEVIISTADSINTTTVGQLDIAIFQNEAGLEASGGNLYLETAASGTANVGTANDTSIGTGAVLQGFLENSNVDPVKEITVLISAQRGYELNSKVIQTADEMMQTANNAKG